MKNRETTNIIVTGAASGLGAAICTAMKELAIFERRAVAIHGVDLSFPEHQAIDVTNFHSSDFPYFGPDDPLDILINCAGINQQAWLHEMNDDIWNRTMAVNVEAMWKLTRYFLPELKHTRGTVLNIVSNAAHMPMRCSLAYNASKAAALMVTKQMARELSGDGVTVFSVSPNKLSGTGMSREIERQVCEKRGWTPEQAADYQKAALLCGEETPPEVVAEFIAFLLARKERHKYLTGCDIPYGV